MSPSIGQAGKIPGSRPGICASFLSGVSWTLCAGGQCRLASSASFRFHPEPHTGPLAHHQDTKTPRKNIRILRENLTW